MPTTASPARVRAARLEAHGLRRGLPSITAAVRRLGAVQAQDFGAARWVLGARVPGSVVADVDAAIASREIVRSWPMRGTLHFVPAEALRAILAITGPRELQRATTRHRQLELDAGTHPRARAVAERALAGTSLSREELLAAWEAAGIATTGQRGYHLIWRLAQEAVVCCGPVEGRGQRFVLLDEWAPATGPQPEREQTLAELLVAYAAGHGPVTVRDFAWWTGLTLGDARLAHAAAGAAVVGFDDAHHVFADSLVDAGPVSRGGRRHALAAFDEYFLGYAERGAVCDPRHAPRVVPGSNGVFQPILVDGRGVVEGVWRVARTKGAASVTLHGFEGAVEASGYRTAFARWARFHGEHLGSIGSAED
jgi:hypothetical protein